MLDILFWSFMIAIGLCGICAQVMMDARQAQVRWETEQILLFLRLQRLHAANEAAQRRKRRPSRAWHAVLGVSENASLAEIKGAHGKLVKKYHPDTAPDGKGNRARFEQVRNAYRVGKEIAQRSDPTVH